MNRAITYHKTVLAKGTADETAIITALFQGSTMTLLTDGVDVMLPVGVAYTALKGTLADDPDVANTPGFTSLLAFLEQLHGEQVSWLVLDAKPVKMAR